MPADGPVDWAIAERVAVRVAGEHPLARSYLSQSLPADLAELTPLAEDLVHATTGLRSLGGPAHAVVVDRAEWIQANLVSFRRILAPLLDRMAERSTMRGPARAATRAVAGAEVGTLLGWMSRRVLGQYDLLVADAAPAAAPATGASNTGVPDAGVPAAGGERAAAGDTVYLVGPNVLGIEKRWGFAPREFRLWLALHEVTHRAQFTGVPWMRDHYLGLVRESVESVDPDAKQLVDSLRGAAASIRRDGLRAFDDGGIAAVLATPRQREVLERIGGLMTLLEGHGDLTMDRAAEGHVPGAERFGRVLRERRQNGSPVTRVVMKLTGIEAKLNQYAHGEAFIAAIEAVDPALVSRCWASPDNLPTLEEIKAPERWLARTAPAGS